MINKIYSPIKARYKVLLTSLRLLGKRKNFSKVYLLGSFIVLGITTYIWASFGADLQNSNADQLVNTYLFQDSRNLSQAILPPAHSFLIKWPLYWLIDLFGPTAGTISLLTIAAVFLTISSLVFILSRIERRELVLGTLVLFLAATLFLVPTVPHPGNLLPVNMAMLATRNLEYVFYILSLWLLLKYPKFKDWRFWLAALILAVVIASDKLFLILSLGGALASLTFYSLASGWRLVSLSSKWVAGSILGLVSSVLILELLSVSKITNFINGSAMGPYGITDNFHDFILGSIYAVLGVLTNFGANPADQTSILKLVPGDARHNLFGLAGPLYILNLFLLCFGLYCAVRLLARSLLHNKNQSEVLETPSKLSLMLLFSSAAALVAFIFSNHYYAADARYLTVFVFAIFITLASHSKHKKWDNGKLIILGGLTFVFILLATPQVVDKFNTNKRALKNIDARNITVADAMNRHKIDILVGDYWRVIPAKFSGGHNINIMPLENCTDVRSTLTSDSWKYDLKTKSFAYLLSMDKSLTDFPQCTLNQIVEAYGRPNASLIIEGTYAKPKELLLFYDKGANNSAPTAPQPISGTATVVPVGIDEFPYRACNVPTIVQVVAHEDDDLLFMSPDLMNDINQGHCIRSIYVTAGDAGGSSLYWLSRQQGTEAAYSKLSGSNSIWIERIVRLQNNQLITIANPQGNPKISLVFMYLPDGNLRGQGFSGTQNQSLDKLEKGKIDSIGSVYLDSHFSSSQFEDALTQLFHLYQPTEIRTHSSNPGSLFIDHSDHLTVGRYAVRAYNTYISKQFEGKVNIPITFYLGYPGHELSSNISGDDLARKEKIFEEYSKFDGGVCRSIEQCRRDPAYGAYLSRQYRSDK